MFEERWYQKEASEILYKKVVEDKNCHPIAAIPTAAGKTIVLCNFLDRYLTENPRHNVLILSHVKEILEQDHAAICEYFEWDEDSPLIGIYSAGLNERKIKKVTVAGIQSIYRKHDLFSDYQIVIIDECHLINNKAQGMYRTFLEELDANYIGLTATPYRTDQGYLHQGESSLFNDLAYDLTSIENFNRLTDEGYLCKLYGSTPQGQQMSTVGIKTIAGDFSQKDLSKHLDRSSITSKAIEKAIEVGKDYKKWLFFAIDIKHAENIKRNLLLKNISAEVVHSEMDTDRSEIIKKFKAGKYKALINVNMLTTGFNDPEIDMIVLMRPTKSPILHVQTIGRGLRPFKGKDHCRILDFAGNIKRLGPINDVYIKKKGEKTRRGTGAPLTKACPECECLNSLAAMECLNCGLAFKREERLQTNYDADSEVVRKKAKPKNMIIKKDQWYEVKKISYKVLPPTTKRNRQALAVIYETEDGEFFRENVDIDGFGMARMFAQRWIECHWDSIIEKPRSMNELIDYYKLLKVPERILGRISLKFGKVHNEVMDWGF